MAKINATRFLVYVNGTAIGSTTTASISVEVDLPSTTTKDSGGWAEHLQGLRNASGSFEGLEDPTQTMGATELFDLITNRTKFDLLLVTDTAGEDGFSASASISNLEFEYEMEQPVSLSGSFTVDGELTRRANT